MNNLITPKQLQKMLNRSGVTIWRWWAKDKILPSPILIQGKALGWRSEIIEQWILDNEGVA